ncbi:MAG TPA: hypothetical protein VHP34_00400 [Alphaproteobacteria bacterium]|nr:hypothetical protein [Alphaproteobacteria bacterium]
MKTPPVKLVFFYLMLLGFISLNLEAEVFRFKANTELVIYMLIYWLPVTIMLALAFIGFFYQAQSTKKFLIFAAIFYAAYVLVFTFGGSGGYVRHHHEIVSGGHYTTYGIVSLTFNFFLAPLVLAINMYVFDILFKKRFQRKQQNNQGKA